GEVGPPRGQTAPTPIGLPQAADAAEPQVGDPAVAHLAGEVAGVVAAGAVVPAAIVVAPPAAPVGVAGVDRDAALDVEPVALVVDAADVGHPGVAAVRIAVGLLLRGVDALLDRLARVA